MSNQTDPFKAGPSAAYPPPVDRLLNELAKLPGIGRRSAERLAFHVLKSAPADAAALAESIRDVKKLVRHCGICFNFTDSEVCSICADPRRDASTVLVVEQPRDLIAIESTGMYRGVYHVLMGRLSPLDGVGPDDLTIGDLMARIGDSSRNARSVEVAEVVLGMNPTLEGDGTALHLAEALASTSVKVSRLARGLPSGGQLDLASKAVLADAIEGRRSVG